MKSYSLFVIFVLLASSGSAPTGTGDIDFSNGAHEEHGGSVLAHINDEYGIDSPHELHHVVDELPTTDNPSKGIEDVPPIVPSKEDIGDAQVDNEQLLKAPASITNEEPEKEGPLSTTDAEQVDDVEGKVLSAGKRPSPVEQPQENVEYGTESTDEGGKSLNDARPIQEQVQENSESVKEGEPKLATDTGQLDKQVEGNIQPGDGERPISAGVEPLQKETDKINQSGEGKHQLEANEEPFHDQDEEVGASGKDTRPESNAENVQEVNVNNDGNGIPQSVTVDKQLQDVFGGSQSTGNVEQGKEIPQTKHPHRVGLLNIDPIHNPLTSEASLAPVNGIGDANGSIEPAIAQKNGENIFEHPKLGTIGTPQNPEKDQERQKEGHPHHAGILNIDPIQNPETTTENAGPVSEFGDVNKSFEPTIGQQDEESLEHAQGQQLESFPDSVKPSSMPETSEQDNRETAQAFSKNFENMPTTAGVEKNEDSANVEPDSEPSEKNQFIEKENQTIDEHFKSLKTTSEAWRQEKLNAAADDTLSSSSIFTTDMHSDYGQENAGFQPQDTDNPDVIPKYPTKIDQFPFDNSMSPEKIIDSLARIADSLERLAKYPETLAQSHDGTTKEQQETLKTTETPMNTDYSEQSSFDSQHEPSQYNAEPSLNRPKPHKTLQQENGNCPMRSNGALVSIRGENYRVIFDDSSDDQQKQYPGPERPFRPIDFIDPALLRGNLTLFEGFAYVGPYYDPAYGYYGLVIHGFKKPDTEKSWTLLPGDKSIGFRPKKNVGEDDQPFVIIYKRKGGLQRIYTSK